MELGAMCGMTETEFWSATPRFMSAKVNALESERQLNWEQSRYIAFHAIKPGDHKNRLKKLTDLGRFPWEKSAFIPQTAEELEAFSDEADEALRIVNPGLYELYMAEKLKHKNGAIARES